MFNRQRADAIERWGRKLRRLNYIIAALLFGGPALFVGLSLGFTWRAWTIVQIALLASVTGVLGTVCLVWTLCVLFHRPTFASTVAIYPIAMLALLCASAATYYEPLLSYNLSVSILTILVTYPIDIWWTAATTFAALAFAMPAVSLASVRSREETYSMINNIASCTVIGLVFAYRRYSGYTRRSLTDASSASSSKGCYGRMCRLVKKHAEYGPAYFILLGVGNLIGVGITISQEVLVGQGIWVMALRGTVGVAWVVLSFCIIPIERRNEKTESTVPLLKCTAHELGMLVFETLTLGISVAGLMTGCAAMHFYIALVGRTNMQLFLMIGKRKRVMVITVAIAATANAVLIGYVLWKMLTPSCGDAYTTKDYIFGFIMTPGNVPMCMLVHYIERISVRQLMHNNSLDKIERPATRVSDVRINGMRVEPADAWPCNSPRPGAEPVIEEDKVYDL